MRLDACWRQDRYAKSGAAMEFWRVCRAPGAIRVNWQECYGASVLPMYANFVVKVHMGTKREENSILRKNQPIKTQKRARKRAAGGLDELDTAILRHLEQNGRATNL